jgi:hypothetical protein
MSASIGCRLSQGTVVRSSQQNASRLSFKHDGAGRLGCPSLHQPGTYKMARVPPPEIEFDGTDMFVCYAGKRIAKRGHPATPDAMTWVSLEPGFVVTSPPDHSTIAIDFNGMRVH